MDKLFENMNKTKVFLANHKRDGLLTSLSDHDIYGVAANAACPWFIMHYGLRLKEWGETFETIDDGRYFTDRFLLKGERIAENWQRDNRHFAGGKEVVFIYIDDCRNIIWAFNEENHCNYDLDCPMIEDIQAAIDEGLDRSKAFGWEWVNRCVASGAIYDSVIDVFTYADKVAGNE